MKRQQEKSQQTKEELMASANELFGRKGFAATTIAEITKNAGYAKGSFYRHWEGKDEIILELIEIKLGSYREERARRIEKAENLEEVMNIIIDFLEGIMADKSWGKVFLEFTIHASRDEELRHKLNKSVYRLSNKTFAELVRKHVDTDFPLEKIGALNTALFEGFLIHSILETNRLDMADFRDAALTLALARGKKSFKTENGQRIKG